MNTISRAQFLRGDWRGHKQELRPPWALNGRLFIESCDGCGDCVGACPQDILKLERGLAIVDFSSGECTFCGECRSACPTGAIKRTELTSPETGQAPWPYRAAINALCPAKNGTFCMVCAESCERQAILAGPTLGGRLDINVDQAACNGCGACIAVCPASAIDMQT